MEFLLSCFSFVFQNLVLKTGRDGIAHSEIFIQKVLCCFLFLQLHDCIHAIGFKEASVRFSFHFTEILKEKCIEYIQNFSCRSVRFKVFG